MLKKYEIHITALLIIGLPGNTYKTDKLTIEKVRDLGMGSIVSIFAPYPGTEAANSVSSEAGFELVEDIEAVAPSSKNQPRVFVSSREYNYREVEKMYYYAHLGLGKYGTLLEPRATAVEKAIELARLIVKYDRSHVFGHLLYMIKRLTKGHLEKYDFRQ